MYDDAREIDDLIDSDEWRHDVVERAIVLLTRKGYGALARRVMPHERRYENRLERGLHRTMAYDATLDPYASLGLADQLSPGITLPAKPTATTAKLLPANVGGPGSFFTGSWEQLGRLRAPKIVWREDFDKIEAIINEQRKSVSTKIAAAAKFAQAHNMVAPEGREVTVYRELFGQPKLPLAARTAARFPQEELMLSLVHPKKTLPKYIEQIVTTIRAMGVEHSWDAVVESTENAFKAISAALKNVDGWTLEDSVIEESDYDGASTATFIYRTQAGNEITIDIKKEDGDDAAWISDTSSTISVNAESKDIYEFRDLKIRVDTVSTPLLSTNRDALDKEIRKVLTGAINVTAGDRHLEDCPFLIDVSEHNATDDDYNEIGETPSRERKVTKDPATLLLDGIMGNMLAHDILWDPVFFAGNYDPAVLTLSADD